MSVRIINADVMDGLAQLEEESVHCVVTSPPYWGLRDYGTARWEGGDTNCQHQGMIERTMPAGSAKQASNRGAVSVRSGDCLCGATRIDNQLGLESTLDEHIEAMVRVFREVRRVLRKDGTLWLNYGDSYAGGGNNRGNNSPLSAKQASNGGDVGQVGAIPVPAGLKPKDLCGVPWRVAFALQADGWWLRQDIIWSKPNPMPESVKDRCTKAHEYIFLLAKSQRYYFDAEAIAETATPGKHITTEKSFGTQAAGAVVKPSGNQIPGTVFDWGSTRNKRSVWEIATQPFPGAHFATFPPALLEPCIKAGCPEKVCAKCGAPWMRDIEIIEAAGHKPRLDEKRFKCGSGPHPSSVTRDKGRIPSCECDFEYTTHMGTVLDPFGGSGTTGLVADRLKRNAILIELNPEYAAMAEKRIKGDCPMFAEVGL